MAHHDSLSVDLASLQVELRRWQSKMTQAERRHIKLQAEHQVKDKMAEKETAAVMSHANTAEAQLRIISAASHDLQGPFQALMDCCVACNEQTADLPEEVIDLLEVLEAAYKNGGQAVSNLQRGSRVIAGHYQRPIIRCPTCGSEQSIDTGWLPLVGL